jgi:hypothetical protein
LTDPSGITPYTAEETQLKLAAISHFKGYVGTDSFIGTVMRDAQDAPSRILSEEKYRNEVTEEFAKGDTYE